MKITELNKDTENVKNLKEIFPLKDSDIIKRI
jgi:hypothetical protein